MQWMRNLIIFMVYYMYSQHKMFNSFHLKSKTFCLQRKKTSIYSLAVMYKPYFLWLLQKQIVELPENISTKANIFSTSPMDDELGTVRSSVEMTVQVNVPCLFRCLLNLAMPIEALLKKVLSAHWFHWHVTFAPVICWKQTWCQKAWFSVIYCN